MASIEVLNQSITVLKIREDDYISLTDILKSKDGDFFISDWLRNRNTIEYLGIWEKIHNPNFNYGEFATITSQEGLNNYIDNTELYHFGASLKDLGKKWFAVSKMELGTIGLLERLS